MSKINNCQLKDNEQQFQRVKILFQQQKYSKAEIQLASLIEDVPDNVEYLHFMAHIKERRHLYKEQLAFLEKALTIKPKSSDVLLGIAYVQFTLYDFSASSQYAALTLKGDCKVVDIYLLTSRLYHKLGMYDKAAQVLEVAAERFSDNANIYYDLGSALTLCGKIKAAIIAYQKSIELDPTSGLALAGLTKTRKATSENNNIDKLRTLADKNRNSSMAINVYHGLSNELNDLGLYQEAFAALAKGKKRFRAISPHDPAKGAINIQRLASLYEKKKQEIRDTFEGSTAAPIFVTGMPRTGTTVVERILTNHKDLVTVGERFQFNSLLKQQCQRAYAGLIDADVLDEVWDSINFEKLGNDYIQSVGYLSNNNHRFVDKLPLNILLSGVILRALPKAKIVCLLRNPLDTIIGNYRQIFEQKTGAYTHTLDLHALASFVYEFRELVKKMQLEFPDRFTVVNYEDLVEAPVAEAKKLFKFCELTWDECYLDIHKNKAPIGTASAAQVQEPIHKKSIGQSKNYMFCLEEIKLAFQEKGEI